MVSESLNKISTLETSNNWMVNAGIFVKFNSYKVLYLLLFLSFKTIHHFVIKDVNFVNITSTGLKISFVMFANLL